jgi:hypothetical protein
MGHALFLPSFHSQISTEEFKIFPYDRRANWWKEHLDLSQVCEWWAFEGSHVKAFPSVR